MSTLTLQQLNSFIRGTRKYTEHGLKSMTECFCISEHVGRCIQPNSLTTPSSQETAQTTSHQEAWWRKPRDLPQPTKKCATNCCEIMAKLPLHDPRHHRYTPSLSLSLPGVSHSAWHIALRPLHSELRFVQW